MENVFIAQSANKILIEYIKTLNANVSLVPRSPLVYSEISDHPDIFMCRFDDGEMLFAKEHELGFSYPYNIAFNAVCLGNYFIHNLEFTNPRLMQKVREKGLKPIDVKQGYTKCNICIVDSSSVITSDPSIISALKDIDDIDVLGIRSGHVKLEGFEYGFLGGASGKIGNDIIFNGDVSLHPDFENIKNFIESKNCRIKYFTEYPLTDIGSIIA